MYIILLLFQIVKSKELFKLEIDQSYQFHREAPNTWVGYPVQYLILEIPKEKSDQDIWVWLIHLNHNSFNSIQLQYSKTDFQQFYLSIIRVRKVGQQLCLYKDLIICTLQSKLQRHYFQVICQNSCHYEIKVIQEKPDIYLNNFLMIGSKEKTQQNLIKINLTNFEYDRLQLKITFLKDTNISNVYINMNQTIPTTTEFEMSFSIMPNILNNLYFRKNSTYSSDEISLIFETQGGLFFQQKSYNKVENISLYQKLEDEIIKDSINYYQLIIEDFKENSLAFEIFIANDKLLLFIQPCIEAKCEGDYRDFDWQFQFDNYNNLFVIPPYKMVYTKVYLITIITENITQQYTFEVKRIENRREKINFLNSNQGILQKNQMAQFLVESSKWTGDKQLIIQAKFSKGHGIILGKKCSKDSQEMEIIVDEYEYLQNADTNNYYNCSFTQEQFNLYSSDIIQTDTVIEILQNQTESQTNVSMLSFEIFSCNYVYVVAIYSYVDFMQFSMIAQVKSNLVRYIDLRQLEIQYNDLSDQQIENYSIAITYTNQSEVHFCIATYQGELQASFKQQSPTETKLSVNNKVTTLDLISIRYQIVSTYNYFTIYVKGQSYLKFSLIPIIKNLQNPEIQYIRLQQMIPFKTFDLNLYYKIEVLNISHLYINLKSLQGDFICYILSSDKIIGNLTPIQSNLSFTSIHQTIILENPKQFQYLYVKSLSQGINESYQIMYYFSGSFIQLNFGNTFYGMLNDQDKMYFYYQSFKTHQKLYIIKTYQSELNNNNSLQIYISLVNKCPNKFNYKYKIQPSESYIAISNFEQGTIIYIGVHSQGINKYTLLIKEKDQQIELKDNIIQTLPTLEQNYHYFYYVIPRDINNPIKIQAFTKYNLIELLCNIVKFNNQYPEKEFYPTNDDYEIKELPSSNPSNKLVFINLIQLQKCRENGCILLISTQVLGQYENFSIMISSKYTIIRNLDMINGYAINSIMSYYKFDVYEMIGMIQITVRTIHNCDCDIYVSKSNLSSYLDYPTTDQYTYKFTSDTLEIENQNNIGQYMIGVIGQDCIFEVLLHLGGFQMHYIHNGQYIDTMIENKVQYYYMNNHQQSFRILISNMKNLLFQIHVLDENETFQLVNNEDLFGGVIQINKDICESCTYILNITPIRFTVLSILLTYNNIPQPMQYGRIYYDYCQETCEFNLQPGELSLFLYSKSVQLTFHSKFELINKMDLSYSNHIIPINESCLLRICNNSYYSIHLNNRDNPTILQLGKLFEGRNTIEKNKMKFNFKVINVKLDYEIQVQGKSDIIIDVYDSNSNKVMPKSSYELNKQIKRLIYQFDNIQKPYQIILFCNDDYHIMVNTYNQNHIKYINFNNHYIEIIEESQHYNVQHILDQDLQYEILDCLGRSEMQQTSLGQSKDVFFRLQSKDRTQPYPFNIVSFVPHQQYSHDKWYIKNTKLQGIQFLNDQIEITINTMRRKKTGSLKLNKLIYKLHLSDQQNIMKALGCEIDIGFLQNYTDRPIFYNYTILEVKEKDVSIQFTVLRNRELIYGLLVFQAYYENYNIPYTYFYEVTQIYNEKEQQPKRKMDKENEDLKLDYILIVIFISLIFSMVLVSQCVCKSHQKEKRRQLNEEQQQLKEQELFKLHQ